MIDRIGAGRVGGAAGLLLVALFASSIPPSLGEPSLDASANSWLAWYHASHSLVAIGAFEAVALPCFVVFVAGLWVRLRSTSDRASGASIALLIGASETVAMYMASGAANEAAAIRVDRGLDLSEAGTLADLATGFFVMSWIGVATVVFAAGVGIIASGALPRWLGWVAVVIGAAHLVAEAFPLTALGFVALLAFYVWVPVTSVLLLRSAGVKEPTL